MDIESINEDMEKIEVEVQFVSPLASKLSEEPVVFSMPAFKKILGMWT